MSSEKKSLVNLDSAQLEALLASLGAPAYRAKQIQHWIYGKYAAFFDEMANLPKELRRRLSREKKHRPFWQSRCMPPAITVIDIRRPLLSK
jgi:adenine C2-methylase RlmN of 23S rRNA A2503 and tRNA A37